MCIERPVREVHVGKRLRGTKKSIQLVRYLSCRCCFTSCAISRLAVRLTYSGPSGNAPELFSYMVDRIRDRDTTFDQRDLGHSSKIAIVVPKPPASGENRLGRVPGRQAGGSILPSSFISIFGPRTRIGPTVYMRRAFLSPAEPVWKATFPQWLRLPREIINAPCSPWRPSCSRSRCKGVSGLTNGPA
jgi:hypothetical protein